MAWGDWNVNWLGQNANRAYPLAVDATRADASGTFLLPDDFLVGLYFPVPLGAEVVPERFFLRSLAVYPSGAAIGVAYDDGTADPPIVASAAVARSGHVENRDYALPGAGGFADATGRVAVGRFEGLDGLPAGRFLFDYAGGKLDADCVRPQLGGLAAILVPDGAGGWTRLTGEVELEAGTNARISLTRVGDVARVRVDAISGEGLDDSCACEGTGPPIRTINGIPPTPAGEFSLLGDDCLTITPRANGLRLSDRCSRPCCGCPELESLTGQVKLLNSAGATLGGFVSRLDREVSSLVVNALGSRLAESPCVSC
jgi:hypothetical protein